MGSYCGDFNRDRGVCWGLLSSSLSAQLLCGGSVSVRYGVVQLYSRAAWRRAANAAGYQHAQLLLRAYIADLVAVQRDLVTARAARDPAAGDGADPRLLRRRGGGFRGGAVLPAPPGRHRVHGAGRRVRRGLRPLRHHAIDGELSAHRDPLCGAGGHQSAADLPPPPALGLGRLHGHAVRARGRRPAHGLHPGRLSGAGGDRRAGCA